MKRTDICTDLTEVVTKNLPIIISCQRDKFITLFLHCIQSKVHEVGIIYNEQY